MERQADLNIEQPAFVPSRGGRGTLYERKCVLVLDHDGCLLMATNVKGGVKQMQKDRCASYVPLLCEPGVPAP